MRLSREKIQRMIDASGLNTNARRSGGGSGAGGGGGVSAQWVEEHYINKEFFSALFKILNGQGSSATEIEPNDTDTIEANPNTVNIEAMFGFWTQKFISALGQGSGGGVIHTTTGLLSDDYVTALSDIRFKDVVRKFTLSVDDIAGASLILFTWKGRDDDRHHAGVIAQEWQKILPEAVVEGEDGKLGVDYGVIGAASAVSLARKVKEQQEQIEMLTKKNAELEKRLARLEKMFALTEED